MGIYIKGVDIPKDGLVRNISIFDNGDVRFYGGSIVIGKAIELPPHGRLGDLDALERNLREMADYQHGDRQQGILGCCSTICSADTIIPADGSADE